jgi:hypothetical protein
VDIEDAEDEEGFGFVEAIVALCRCSLLNKVLYVQDADQGLQQLLY